MTKKEVKAKLKAEELANYQACIKLMFDWMEWPTNGYMPPMFFKRLKDWHTKNNFGYEVILETMNITTDTIKRINQTKSFENDSAKLRYFIAIIGNSLNDGLKSYLRKQKAINESRKETNTPTEDDINNFNNQQITSDRSKLNDVMKDVMGDLW